MSWDLILLGNGFHAFGRDKIAEKIATNILIKIQRIQQVRYCYANSRAYNTDHDLTN